MHWTKIVIDTSPDGIGLVGGLLEDMGITGYIVEDEKDFLDFLETNRQCWDYVDDGLLKEKRGISRVIYFSDLLGNRSLEKLKRSLEALRSEYPGLCLGTLSVSTSAVESEDWENGWKQYYKPIEIGENLIVVPSWEMETDTGGRTAVFLDPGMSFGTGGHASTRLCLAELERYVKKGMSVLDLGCGSGILSISALKLGASYAAACDIDPIAADTARKNAELNGIGRDTYTVFSGDILKDSDLKSDFRKKRFNIVLANIVADVIIPLSAEAGNYIAPHGLFICSGIINERAGDVRTALAENGFSLINESTSEGWTAFTAGK